MQKLIQTEAEKEFKDKFSRVCQFVTETNKPDFLVLCIPENSEQKIKSLASVTNWQTDVFRVIQPDFGEQEDLVCKIKMQTGDG